MMSREQFMVSKGTANVSGRFRTCSIDNMTFVERAKLLSV